MRDFEKRLESAVRATLEMHHEMVLNIHKADAVKFREQMEGVIALARETERLRVQRGLVSALGLNDDEVFSV